MRDGWNDTLGGLLLATFQTMTVLGMAAFPIVVAKLSRRPVGTTLPGMQKQLACVRVKSSARQVGDAFERHVFAQCRPDLHDVRPERQVGLVGFCTILGPSRGF